MAAIASRPQVVEIESQVRLLLDGYLVVSMQVAFTASEGSTQFIQHLLCRWNPESSLPEYSDDRRLPAAIHASPAVALKAEDPQPAMVCVVSALGACAAAFVVFTLSRTAVLFTGTAGSEVMTARERAGAQDPPDPTGLLVGYRVHLGIHTDDACRDLGVGVRSWVAGERTQFVDQPQLVRRHRLQDRGLPFSSAAFVP